MTSTEFCKLCFNPIGDGNFQVIENSTKHILNFLLLNLNFDQNVVYVMCKTCFKKMMEAFEFKSTCICTDATIIPYIELKTLPRFDLEETHLKERGHDHSNTSLKAQKICRLCMQLTENDFFSLQELNNEMLQNFFPEINVDIKGDPVVCNSCFGLFHSISKFLQNCLDVNKNTMHFDRLREGSQGVESSFDPCTQRGTKLGNVKSECTENEDMAIKTEDIQIKPEVDETYVDHSTFSTTAKGTTVMDAEKLDVKIYNKRNEGGLCEYNNCDYESNNEVNSHAKHKTEEKFFICYTCGFKARHKINLQWHCLKHKNASEVKTFNCNFCSFKTKYETSFQRHVKWQHKKLSEVRMYECNSCEFNTKYKHSLAYHQLKHKKRSDVPLYKCDLCDFKTKYKTSVKKHLRKHEHPTGMRMFKCDTCDYESNYEANLRKHNERKHSSEVSKCKYDSCDLETMYKYGFEEHQLKHIKNVLK